MEELLGEVLGGLFGELVERLGKRLRALFREQPAPSDTLKVSCEQCGWCFWAPEASLGQRCGHCRQGRLYRAYWFDHVTVPPPDPLFLPIGAPALPLSLPVLASPSSNRLTTQSGLSRRRRSRRRRNQDPIHSPLDSVEPGPASSDASPPKADHPFLDQG